MASYVSDVCFLLLSSMPLYGCNNLHIHSPVEGHLGLFSTFWWLQIKSPRSFKVFTFQSSILFDLIFPYDTRYGLRNFFFGIWISNCLKRLSFFIEMHGYLWQKPSDHMCVGRFQVSISLLCFDHHSRCLYYSKVIVSLDIVYSVSPPNLFFFKIVLAILIPLPFQLRISLLSKRENLARILIRHFKVLLWYNTRFTKSSKIM